MKVSPAETLGGNFLYITYRTMDSYSIHSFDPVSPGVTVVPHQNAGNAQPPAHAGT